MNLNRAGIEILDTVQQLQRRRKLKGDVAALREREEQQRIQFRVASNPNNKQRRREV